MLFVGPLQNVEILNGYQNMREEYLKIRSTAPEIAHVMEESPDVSTANTN